MERYKQNINHFRSLMTEEKKEEILAKAADGMQGLLILNGTGATPHNVGNPPRWDENPYGVGGYTWTMSRLMYMTTLAQAYLLTGKEAYMQKIAADLWDWLQKEPAPPVPVDLESALYYHNVHHWRMLEIGWRPVYTFPILLDALQEYGKEEKLVERLMFCIHQHGERIRAGSYLLWPDKDHNHFLAEQVGLLAVAALNDSDPEADAWAEYAMNEIEICCDRQITEDGAQVEGSSTYHNDCLIHFCMAIWNAQRLGRQFSPHFIEKVKKGIDFSVYTLRPDGKGVTIGDSDADQVAVECVVYAYLLFQEDKWIRAIQGMVSRRIMQEAALHAWGYPNVEMLLKILADDQAQKVEFPLVNIQWEVGQFYARTGWDQEALSLAFICRTPLHHGAHGHIDPLAIDFAAYGRTLLIDPGRFTYKDGEDRHLFKSSAVHNMPTLNGEDAFPYCSTFIYGEQKEGRILKTQDSGRIMAASGYHLNYGPARLERIVGIIDGKFLLMADTFRNAKGNQAKICFHLNSVCVSASVGHAYTEDDAQANISLFSTARETTLSEGRASHLFYCEYPTRRVMFGQEIDRECMTVVTLAIPSRAREERNADVFLKVSEEEKEIRFRLEETDYRISYAENAFHIL